MYNLEIRKHLDKIFSKLAKKNKIQFEALNKKIEQIRKNPYHFKPLRAPMQNKRRVHVGSFVLIYSIDEKTKTIILEDYEHHNKIYFPLFF
ncbi:MAG: type II toxin-antitoxin system mRNA interferase toxin, RelE/StbE family [Candidatus Pacearchaeota archaeon]|nr:MAG: type II toxin-antitoxin system mRNA interferase toxin, RelE/StbE family [Candidatus Pacearchaeota archaeon]